MLDLGAELATGSPQAELGPVLSGRPAKTPTR